MKPSTLRNRASMSRPRKATSARRESARWLLSKTARTRLRRFRRLSDSDVRGRGTRAISQRYIPVLLRWVLVSFGVEHFERLNQPLAGLARQDDGVHVSALGGDVGTGKAVAKFLDLLLSQLLPPARALGFAP